MHIQHLEAAYFRNLERLSLTLDPKWVVLRGANAQGKTNVLEALYVCATGKSFRQAPPRQLLRHGTEQGSVRAIFSRHGVRHEVRVALQPHRRELRVDGKFLRQAAGLLQLVNVVAFFPDDLRIAKGSPEERRRFLDRAVANHRPDFVEALLQYHRVLKQRNALLRRPDRFDATLLQILNRQLVTHGTVVHRARHETLAHLMPRARRFFSHVMGLEAPLEVELISGLGQEIEDFGTQFLEALESTAARDRARGSTSVGPHRADLHLQVAEHDARHFASQGQQRAVVLALKLAELDHLQKLLDTSPILLLDDVSSELDQQRTKWLFEQIDTVAGQVWVSTTGASPLPLPGQAQILEVTRGRVRPANEA